MTELSHSTAPELETLKMTASDVDSTLIGLPPE